MKKLMVVLALLAATLGFYVSACCFGEPQEGQICFIIIPIPLADNGGFTTDSASAHPAECALP